MLYHVPDRDRAFAEVRRILRPGGRFYAATNGAAHLRELGDLLGNIGAVLGSIRGFRLENGAEQLAPHFGTVARHDYEDALVVTEAAPLIAYARSMMHADDHDLARLTDMITRRITSDGAIRITKSTGLFVARKALSPES